MLLCVCTVVSYTPFRVTFATNNKPATPSSSNPLSGVSGAAAADATADAAHRLVEAASACTARLSRATEHELFSLTSTALAVATPVALVLSPSFLNIPVDLALGVVIPFHLHYGLSSIMVDYVPRQHQAVGRILMAITSLLTAIGLLKINLCGQGVTESFKSLWREPKQKKIQQ